MTAMAGEYEDLLELEDEQHEHHEHQFEDEAHEGFLEFEDEHHEHEDFVGELVHSMLGGELSGPLSEHEELEFAHELLEIHNEQELEQFIGKLVRRAVRGVSKFARSSAGRALGGMLRGLAKKALPMVGGALGSVVAPGIGTAIGSRLGSFAGGLLELEHEVGHHELELEMARRVVRIGAAAARNAAAAGHGDPRQIAHRALVAATRRHAPAALPSRRGFRGRRRHLRPRFAYGVPYGAYPYPYPVESANGNGHHEPDDDDQDYEADATGAGKWVRRGRSIVIYGV